VTTDGWRTSPVWMTSHRVAMRMSVTVYSRVGKVNSPRGACNVRIAVSERRSLCAKDNAIHVETGGEAVRAVKAVK
jgi:hypothetical protein